MIISAGFLSDLLKAIADTSLTEWLIFLTALIYVWLAAIENQWCWLFGNLSSALSVMLCYNGQLYMESGLQIFYVVIGFYGWYKWVQKKKSGAGLEEVIRAGEKKELWMLTLMAGILFVPMGFLFGTYSKQVLPYLDALITSFSLVATYMTARKIIENWLYWIAIDALACGLYFYRGFVLVSLLYIIYCIIAWAGYRAWKKTLVK